jgi:glycerol dehydrogenase-like iron-containing ADH family enzyme
MGMINTSYQKVEGHTNLVRDPNTRAIINTNAEQIVKARAVKNARMIKEQEFETVKQDVADMKTDLNDIKLLLQQLADK